MRLLSTIKPASGADGPFYVVTEVDGSAVPNGNVTVGVATVLAALNQARDDQAAALQGTVVSVTIETRAS